MGELLFNTRTVHVSLVSADELTTGSGEMQKSHTVPIRTLIFDIDDTLYPVSSGFSEHRNGPVVREFMMKNLGFKSEEEAMALRKEVFTKHHSTLKGLKAADSEGRLRKPFHPEMLTRWYVDNCDFKGFLKRDEALINHLKELSATGLQLVIYTNAPRAYGLKCLDQLGVRGIFREDHIFGV